MAIAKKQTAKSSADSAGLGALLDKIVAVHLDLQPLCGTSAARTRADATPKVIAEACDVLQSAIADLRNIIHQIDGLAGLPTTVSGRDR